MSEPITMDNAPPRAVVQFNCTGRATGKMRNELDVRMVQPMEERFELATDEGPFHGGDATAPPPLALFVGGLTGCIMTQIRAFAKRLGVRVNDLTVETRVQWDWAARDRVYETAPKSFEIDILIESDDPLDRQQALVQAAKRGCFIEQTLGRENKITHRLKTPQGWVDAD
ncbi:OsmC family protein [Seohaeicola saemankumensis]|nr:OsmC family protein [Seohaeicola saemankumensis]MCA0873768.1 OsmC family protein [Seohaeicola saemankumensis]